MKSETKNQRQSHKNSLYKLIQSEPFVVVVDLRIHFSPAKNEKWKFSRALKSELNDTDRRSD